MPRLQSRFRVTGVGLSSISPSTSSTFQRERAMEAHTAGLVVISQLNVHANDDAYPGAPVDCDFIGATGARAFGHTGGSAPYLCQTASPAFGAASGCAADFADADRWNVQPIPGPGGSGVRGGGRLLSGRGSPHPSSPLDEHRHHHVRVVVLAPSRTQETRARRARRFERELLSVEHAEDIA